MLTAAEFIISTGFDAPSLLSDVGVTTVVLFGVARRDA